MFQRIVVGSDGSERAGKAVQHAAALAKAAGAEVHVVRAVPGPGGDPEGEAEQAADQLRDAGVQVETHVVNDDPSEALISVAEQQDADLIVIGNKGMTGAQRFFLGSVPNDVGHHASCSVLIARTD